MATQDSFDTEAFYADLDRRARERRARRGPRRARRWWGRRRAGRSPRTPLADAIRELRHLTDHGRPRPRRRRGHEAPCSGPAQQRCRKIDVRIDGATQTITLGPVSSAPDIASGTAVRVNKTALQPGVAVPPNFEAYQFTGLDREGPLWNLLAVLGALALVLLRWRGLRGPQTLAAALGISATLLLTCLLAAICVGFVHLRRAHRRRPARHRAGGALVARIPVDTVPDGHGHQH